jgi:hypothetical protein
MATGERRVSEYPGYFTSICANFSVLANSGELVGCQLLDSPSSEQRSLLTLPNSDLLSKTSATAISTFEEKQKQLQSTIEGFQAMQLPVKDLISVSRKQSEMFENIRETIHLGIKTQNKIWSAVQNLEERSNGFHTHS